MTDPVKIANAALEAQLGYFSWASAGDRLEESYADFLSLSAASAGRSMGVDPRKAIERLGYTPEALAYYARSELEMFNTGRTVAVSSDMLEIARFNAGIWWEEKDTAENRRAKILEAIADTGRTYTEAEIDKAVADNTVDWATLGFEADQEGATLPILTREMLPFTEPGVMWFEEPVPYPDFDMEVIDEYGPAGLPTIPVKAIAWREVPEVTIGLDDDGKPITGPGIALFMYVEHPRDRRLLRFDFTGWGYNAGYEVAHDWIAQLGGSNTSGRIEGQGNHIINPHVAMVRILLTSLFGIMRSSIELTKPARAVRRRAEHTGATFPEYGEVQVITLRTFLNRAAAKRKKDGESTREYSHRWIVRGHWAWRHCSAANADEGEDCRKRVYIDAYEKGPEDRPLIIRDKIYAVVR